jgi:hypothetical protein
MQKELKPKKVERESSKRRIDAINRLYSEIRQKRFKMENGNIIEDAKGTIKLDYQDIIKEIALNCFCEPSLVDKVLSGYYTY